MSCAAGLANIQFMQKHDLPGQAKRKGEHVIGKLRELQSQLPIIGDVRGLGLMIGIELVEDAKKTPATAKAEAAKSACFKAGLLIGVGGVYGNVLRLQPPLVITQEQLDRASPLSRRHCAKSAPELARAIADIRRQRDFRSQCSIWNRSAWKNIERQYPCPYRKIHVFSVVDGRASANFRGALGE